MIAKNDPTPSFGSLTRRTFVKALGSLGGLTALGGVASLASVFTVGANKALAAPVTYPGDPLDDDSDVTIMYTSCQMCHARCGMKAKLKNGVLLKVDGNVYSPSNTEYADGTHAALQDTTSLSISSAKPKRGRICGKAQTVVEMLYNATRLNTPLKRVGPRGGGKWEAVSWDTAMNEIVNGGSIDNGDGTSHTFTGLKALRDNTNYIGANGANGGSSADSTNFQGELGKMSNMVMFTPGRHPHGNKEFSDRLWKDCFGTKNYRLDHTSICETSHHVAFKMMTTESNAFSSSQSGKTGFQADLNNVECVLYFGSNPAEAGFSHQSHARKMVNAAKRGAKIYCIDPRLCGTAAIARQNGGAWIPVKPGKDAAIALGMARWAFDNSKYVTAFLQNANKKAAVDDSEVTFSDATWLVNTTTGAFAAGDDTNLGLGGASDERVCLVTGTATKFDPDSTTTAQEGDLFGSVTAGSVVYKTALQLFKEEAELKTIAAWETEAGIAAGTCTTMAQDFFADARLTDRKSMADLYRGPVQHTNGTYTGMCIIALNWLMGNIDRVGGATNGGSHYHETGGKTGNKYTLTSDFHSSLPKVSPSGPRIDRASSNITDFPNFHADENGTTYPTKRPWFPFGQNGVFQEIVPSIGDKYPYPCKMLFSLWNVWPYSTPGGNAGIPTLKDTTLIPCHVAFDVQIGELSGLADYVLPDATFLEIFATPHSANQVIIKHSAFRQPVVGQLYTGSGATNYADVSSFQESTATSPLATAWETAATTGTAVWGANPYWVSPIPNVRMHHDVFIDLAVGTRGIDPGGASYPGVGTNAFTSTVGATPRNSLNTAWDYFVRVAVNLKGEKDGVVPANWTAELAAADDCMRHGGVFKYEDGYETTGNHLTNKFGSTSSPKICHFYLEDLTQKTNSQSGAKDWGGAPKYISTVKDTLGNDVPDSTTTYPFTGITYKLSWHGQGRTVVNPTLMAYMPENYVWVNTSDGSSLSLKTGDSIRLTSASNSKGVTGKAFLTEAVRPGVIAVSHHFGHTELSSRPHVIGGVVSEYDERRGAGLSINPVLRLDPVLNDVTLQDLVGGSCSFSDTQIKITKV